MKKATRFRVLTPEEYERLTPKDRLAYIDEAFRVAKLGRARGRHRASAAKREPDGNSKKPRLPQRGEK